MGVMIEKASAAAAIVPMTDRMKSSLIKISQEVAATRQDENVEALRNAAMEATLLAQFRFRSGQKKGQRH